MVLPITERGVVSVIIKGSVLQKGMYTYSLVADNKIYDTKKLILTE